jgi:hypothetical protein
VEAITIITGPRTGAGHLIALTQNLEAVAPRDGLFADGFADASGKIDIAELEARGEGKSLLIVKATSAMPREIVERDLLGRPGMRAIIIVRRQIDAYVSLAKATALDAWRDTDLSNVKVKLDVARFASWLDAEEAWYAHWKTWLERRSFPVPVLRYETHINVPPESALRRPQHRSGLRSACRWNCPTRGWRSRTVRAPRRSGSRTGPISPRASSNAASRSAPSAIRSERYALEQRHD